MVKLLNKATFGDKLKALRTEAGIAGAELARATGIHPAMISFLENNHRQPSLTMACLLAKALGISLAEFDDCEIPPLKKYNKSKTGAEVG